MPAAYREHRPPAGLAHAVACLWEQEPAEDRVQRIVPDGCVDLVWLAGRELVIAGPDTGPWTVVLPAGALSSAVRLRPGTAGAFLGVPASELRDQRIGAMSLWGAEAPALEDALAEARPADRLRLLAATVARRRVRADELVVAAGRALSRPGARVGDVAREIGVSERQLHRRALAAVGYGPKMLARVARLRRLIALSGEPLAARAFAAGYASQAHMGDEVRRLTGLTPVRFLEDAALTSA